MGKKRFTGDGLEFTIQGEYLMIGCEIEIEHLEDAVTISLNPDTDDYVIELSPEAFHALGLAIDRVKESGVGYYGRFAFDVDEDED